MFQRGNTDINYADRFIPHRSIGQTELSHFLLNRNNWNTPTSGNLRVDGDSPKHYVNLAHKNFNRAKYAKELTKVMFPGNQKVLVFSVSNKAKRMGSIKSELWPNKARKKPLIGPPSLVLDMPNLDTRLCCKVIDWSNQGNLATIYEREVYLWNENTFNPFVLTNTNKRVENCIAWNKSGASLGISLTESGVLIWDLESNSGKYKSFCMCRYPCEITSMVWTKQNSLVAGCSLGRIQSFSSDLKFCETIYPAHKAAIVSLQFSVNERYLASSGMDKVLRLWMWPQMDPYFEAINITPTRGIAWHPWKDYLLCTGSMEGTLQLWNMNSQKAVAYHKHKNLYIENVTWSEVTGELVVSSWPKTQTLETSIGAIYVLSDFNTIVDAIEWHTSPVPYLLWGANGTQLATVSADENVCVWDFLGTACERDKEIERQKLKNTKMKSVNGMYTFGFSIR